MSESAAKKLSGFLRRIAPAAERRPPSRVRRTAPWALLVILMLMDAVALAQSPQPKISLEYAVKATYLYKLAPFVGWPPGTFSSPGAPFEICVLGRDPFNGFLVQAVAGRRVGTHPFEVRRLATLTQATDCQIVFIGDMRVGAVRAVLQAFEGRPVLTVTDSGDPDTAGSIVQFVLERGHVRFDIDNAVAARHHLAISSKLLSLALTVKGGS